MTTLKAYHGTGDSFNSFDKNKIGTHQNFGDDGFFFITDLEEAEWYANENTNEEEDWSPTVITATINLENPLIISTTIDTNFANPTNYFDKNADSLYRIARKNDNDGIIVNGVGEYTGTTLIVAFESHQITINDTTTL